MPANYDFSQEKPRMQLSETSFYVAVMLVSLAMTVAETLMAIDVPGGIGYLPAIFASFALSVIAQVLLMRWMGSLRKKRASLLDVASLRQATDAGTAAEQACHLLAQERAELLPRLEQALVQAQEDLESARPEDAVRSMDGGLRQLSDVLPASSGKAALDGVLLAKSRQAEAAGLRLEVSAHVPEGCPLSDLELASVAFNLIDNALSAAGKTLQGRASSQADATSATPTVHFRLRGEKGQLVVTVTNPCDSSLRGKQTPRPLRTDDDGSRHGLGMRVVTALAEEHGGIAAFSAKDGQFTARAMVPLGE